MEVGHDSVVQSKLLLLELGDDLLSEVNCDKIEKELGLFDIPLSVLDGVCHIPGVVLGLEKSTHRLLACIDGFKVLLC